MFSTSLRWLLDWIPPDFFSLTLVLNICFYVNFDRKWLKSQTFIHFVLTMFLGNFLDAILVEFWTLFWRSFGRYFWQFWMLLKTFSSRPATYLRSITIIFGRFRWFIFNFRPLMVQNSDKSWFLAGLQFMLNLKSLLIRIEQRIWIAHKYRQIIT